MKLSIKCIAVMMGGLALHSHAAVKVETSIDLSSFSYQLNGTGGGTPTLTWLEYETTPFFTVGDRELIPLSGNNASVMINYDAFPERTRWQGESKYTFDLLSNTYVLNPVTPLDVTYSTDYAGAHSFASASKLETEANARGDFPPESYPADVPTRNFSSVASAGEARWFRVEGAGTLDVSLSYAAKGDFYSASQAPEWGSSSIYFSGATITDTEENSNFYNNKWIYINSDAQFGAPFDESGTVTGRLSFGPGVTYGFIGYHVGSLAGAQAQVSPVPEPETYALMAMGLGILGASAKLKRKNRGATL